MQISRHWRLNSQRYRLEGFRSASGELSLQARPASHAKSDDRILHSEPVMPTSNEEVVASSAA